MFGVDRVTFKMTIHKKCPCCNSKFSFWSYFHQNNFNTEEDKSKNIKCNKCKKIILLANRKRTLKNIGGLIVFIISMYLLIENRLNQLWILGLFLFIIFTMYAEYIQENLICFKDNNLKEYKQSDPLSGFILGIILISTPIIIFWLIFSFALDRKEENNQKQINQSKQQSINNKVISIPIGHKL